MKKLFYLAMAMLFSTMVMAQASKPFPERKTIVSINLGMGVPVGSLASTTDAEAGLAQAGFSASLTASRTIQRGFGVGADLFYSNFGVNNDGLGVMEMNLDHWKVWGLVVGPDLHGKLADKLYLDVRLHAGVARANSPTLSYRNQSTEDVWSTALTFRPGADLRLFVNERTFLRFGFDYTYLDPKFSYSDIGEFNQKMSSLHYGLGFGFSF